MVIFHIKDLNIWFGSVQALKNVDIELYPNEILSVIGPSNSGKTTFLKMLNRLNDLSPNFRMSGEVRLEEEDVRKMDAEILRRKVGMVFALPLPLPLSIFENVAFGVRMHGINNKKRLEEERERERPEEQGVPLLIILKPRFRKTPYLVDYIGRSEEQPCNQVEVVPRGAHGERQVHAGRRQTNLHRFLCG